MLRPPRGSVNDGLPLSRRTVTARSRTVAMGVMDSRRRRRVQRDSAQRGKAAGNARQPTTTTPPLRPRREACAFVPGLLS